MKANVRVLSGMISSPLLECVQSVGRINIAVIKGGYSAPLPSFRGNTGTDWTYPGMPGGGGLGAISGGGRNIPVPGGGGRIPTNGIQLIQACSNM